MNRQQEIKKQIDRLASRSFLIGLLIGVLIGIVVGFAIGHGLVGQTVVVPLSQGIRT